MAGGKGTRLRPLTANRPKPLVPLCNRPIMEYGLILLREYGIKDIGITLYYMPHMVKEYFGDGSSFGVNITYNVERKPLGTAGGVKALEDFLDETFVIISGDVFTDIDIGKLIEYHKSKGAIFTIALIRVEDPTEYGIALLNDEGKIIRYLEKPSWGEVFSDLANTGIYVAEPEVLRYIPRGKSFDFSKNLFPTLLERGEEIYGFIAEKAYWSDVGNHIQYVKTTQDILDEKARVNIPGVEVKKGLWVGRNVEISEYAEIIPPVAIGNNVKIYGEARIGPYTVIGDNCKIDDEAVVERSILWDNVYIGKKANINTAIVCSRTFIGEGAKLDEYAVVGDDCKIGAYSHIKSGILVWPSKVIDPYTTVSVHVKWGVKWPIRLFGPYGIEGVANIEVTPEIATKIGLAIGTWLGKGAKVAVARDPYRSSRVIKRAIVSGLMASGVIVYNLTVAPAPVLRQFIRKYSLDAGVIVETSMLNPRIVKIRILDRDGIELDTDSERKIERIFLKEAFTRVLSEDVGEIIYPKGYMLDYINYVLNKVDKTSIRRRKFKIVIDCSNGSASFILPRILEVLGLEATLINSRADENLTARPIIKSSGAITVLTTLVKSLEADLGILFDEGAERIVVVDRIGNIVSGDLGLALYTKLQLEREGEGNIIVPISASKVIDVVAEKYGGKVIREKIGAKYILRAIERERAIFGGEERGAYVFPKFHPGFDGLIAMIRLLEELAVRDETLSGLLRGIPSTYMLKKSLRVDFTLRGYILRKLIDELKEREIDTIDGIKIIESKGWVLIHPRPHEPFFDIFVEADTLPDADSLLRTYFMLIENILKSRVR